MNPHDYATPVHLVGEVVSLEPLAVEHHDALVEAVRDGDLWQLWYTRIPSPAEMATEIAERLAKQEAGAIAAFTVRSAVTGVVLGMTTYLHLDPANRRLEIGSTWLRASAQGTGVNAEAKLLLLQHAFEVLGCEGVELRAHHMNTTSRRAIERLGAHLDGVLRRQTLLPNGTWRDTCVYSLLAHEWPTVRAGLHARLAAVSGSGRPG